jgi:SAM-dependent methyltransferase
LKPLLGQSKALEKKMNAWFQDENIWIKTFPFMFNEERLKSSEKQVNQLLELTGFTGKEVLDLCCGPGRHSVLLARKGFRVTAVDGSTFLLNKARERGKEAGVEVEWIQQDMREFVRPEAFGLAINIFTSFGYFDEEEDDMKVLANIHASLKPGGILVMELMSKENLAMVFQPTTSQQLPDGTTLVQRHHVYDDWTRARNEWFVIKDGKADVFHFDLRVYSGSELRQRLNQEGFSEVKLYGDLEGNAFDHEKDRLCVVARKA